VITDPWFYALAAPAVILLGLAKGGFAGIGVIAVPLMALAVSPVLAASITLPILIVQDVVSVWAFRKTWDRAILMLMLPSAAVGIFVGFALAAFVKPGAVELAVGAISVVFAVQRLWLERTGRAGARGPRRGAALARGAGRDRGGLHQPDQPCRRAAVPDVRPAQAAGARRVHRHQRHLLRGGELDEGPGLSGAGAVHG
jgi:uncharacterized membrane protein YfcA